MLFPSWSYIVGKRILGNFSTDQLITELAKISQKWLKTVKMNSKKIFKIQKGHGWAKWEKITSNVLNYCLVGPRRKKWYEIFVYVIKLSCSVPTVLTEHLCWIRDGRAGGLGGFRKNKDLLREESLQLPS